MNKKVLVSTIIFLGVSIIGMVILANNKDGSSESVEKLQESNEIILFYGDGCPHCAIVEEYVSENNIESKLLFTKKEVYYNNQNSDELVVKAKICGIPTDSIGVPFLWDGAKCLVGDQDIIEFFKSKANEQ